MFFWYNIDVQKVCIFRYYIVDVVKSTNVRKKGSEQDA